jgi:hypothetical protein
MEAATLAGFISLILLFVCLQLFHTPDADVALDIHPMPEARGLMPHLMTWKHCEKRG